MNEGMGETTLRKALDDYKTVYMPYRNFAQRTRKEYFNDIEDMVGFLEKSGINYVRSIGLPVIERYVAQLEQKGLASLTRKRKVVAIRSFLSFLYQDSYIDTNVAKRIILPFTESIAPHFLTQKESDQLTKACAANPRDRAIIELLLQTGIKLSELVHLTLNDIELDTSAKAGEKSNGFVRILGSRGKKERLIALNTKATIAIMSYLRAKKDFGKDILFLNRFGEPIGERGVQKMLRKYLKEAGIGWATIHTLRHTFGVHFALKAMNQRAISEIMGHKDRRSTLIYISLARELQNHVY